MSKRIDSFALRVQESPDFLSFSLADYARSEKLDDDALAQRLGCDIAQLSRLRLCRKPRVNTELFLQDLSRIASVFDLDLDTLAEAIRRSDALDALRDAEDNTAFLMAARDRQVTDLDPPDHPNEAPK
jgi:hypothetical protein